MPEVTASLQTMLAEGADRLRCAHIDEPRRQTLRIWAELTGSKLGESQLRPESGVDSSTAARFHHAIERRAGGEPLCHVTGWAGFRHLSLRSDARALIPRPETESLVELLLQRVRSGIIADVGTGSGCIALSLATEGAFNRIVAVDCSSEALALARINAELVTGGCAIELVRADLCAPLRPGSFDALISNPPYLTVSEHAALDRSVRDWEPALALASGADGMEATARLLVEGRAALRPGGWLALEVDCSRAPVAARLASELGWQDVRIHMDLFSRERYLLARRSEVGDLG
jgi:release factor glutamine methyltransferase